MKCSKRRGLLSDSQLSQLRQANGDGASLIEKAVALGYVREEAALRALAEEVGLEYVDLRDIGSRSVAAAWVFRTS